MKLLHVFTFTCILLTTAVHAKPAEPAKPAEVFDVKDLDAPPKPTERVGARHPRELLDTSGEAVVRFTVDAKGKPRDIEVISADHKYFGVAAVEAVKEWRFKPAMKDGKPVSCRLQLPFVFHSAPSRGR